MSEGNPYFGATFAERKAARLAAEGAAPAETKQVDDDSDEVEDKAVKSASTKKRAAKKKP
jgi:hypothetical protein